MEVKIISSNLWLSNYTDYQMELYSIISDLHDNKNKTYLLAQRNYRKWEHGKPSKKDRRDIDQFLEGW